MKGSAGETMRNRTIVAVAVLALLPALGCGPIRHLVSGKLDASQSFDFSCSVVNKSPTDTIEVTMALKDGGGNIYINPSTFQPAMLTQEIGPLEAAMLVAPAAFVGVTSLYCWADVPTDSTVFGTFLVRDAQDRSTAATPLQEDEGIAGEMLAQRLTDIDERVDRLTKLDGPVTGAERIELCNDGIDVAPGALGGVGGFPCPAGQVVVGGGCEITSAGGAPELFHFIESHPSDPSGSWSCVYVNNSTYIETVNACAFSICVDDGGAD